MLILGLVAVFLGIQYLRIDRAWRQARIVAGEWNDPEDGPLSRVTIAGLASHVVDHLTSGDWARLDTSVVV